MQERSYSWLAAAVIVGVAAGVAGGVGAADATQDRPTQPAFVVELSESGDATVTLRTTFDLTTEQSTFEELEADASDRTERFRDRLAVVANRTANATGREMAVTNVRSETYAADGVGVLTLTAEWDGLAAETDDGLRLREPFASGFETPRRFVVHAPDGHAVASASPEPTTENGGRVAWAAETDLSGFTVRTTENGTTPETTVAGPERTETRAPTPLPGVILAVIAALAVAGRRRR